MLELEHVFPRKIPDIGRHENVLLNLHQIRPLVDHAARVGGAVFERHQRRAILVTDHLAGLRKAFDDFAHGKPVAHQRQVRAHHPARPPVEMTGRTAGLPEKRLPAFDIALGLEQGLHLRDELVGTPVFDKQRRGDRWRRAGLRRRAEHLLKRDFLRIRQRGHRVLADIGDELGQMPCLVKFLPQKPAKELLPRALRRALRNQAQTGRKTHLLLLGRSFLKERVNFLRRLRRLGR